MRFFYYKKSSPMPDCDFFVTGVGSREKMNCIVNHHLGTDDYLMVFFYDKVAIKRENEIGDAAPGTLVLYDNGVPHYYGSANREWSHSWLNFHGRAVPDILAKAGLLPGSEMHLNSCAELERYLEQIYDEVSLGADCDRRILQHIFSILCLVLARGGQRQSADIPPNLRLVREELDSRFAEEISLQEIARRACLSVPHLCAEFKKYYRVSPIAYKTTKRIENAKYLLNNYNLRIKDIAAECGWSDHFQFSKIFRRHVGCSPGEYRSNKWGGVRTPPAKS